MDITGVRVSKGRRTVGNVQLESGKSYRAPVPELRYQTEAVSLAAVNYSPTGEDFCKIAQGDDIDQRSGRKIKLQGFRVKVLFTGAATKSAGVLRVLVLRNRDGGGNGDLAGGSATSWTLDPDKDIYTVLYDKIHTYRNRALTAGDVAGSCLLDFFVPCNSIVRYKGTTASDLTNESYTLALITNDSSVGSASGSCITYYRDV